MYAAGALSLEPAGQAYPALQLLQTVAPDTLNAPAGHCTAVAFVAPLAEHT
jgi:hypothetical protein